MAMYPYSFSSDPSLGPKVKTNKKRGVGQMACCGKSKCKSTAKKSSAKKSTSTKKSSCKKKPC
jgi:hypothetical protein